MFCIFCCVFSSIGYCQRWRITCLFPVRYNHDELHEEWPRSLSGALARGKGISLLGWAVGYRVKSVVPGPWIIWETLGIPVLHTAPSRSHSLLTCPSLEAPRVTHSSSQPVTKDAFDNHHPICFVIFLTAMTGFISVLKSCEKVALFGRAVPDFIRWHSQKNRVSEGELWLL